MEKEKKINIVLSNAWSYYNKGDGAIVISMIKNLDDSFSNADFSILAFDPTSFELSKKMGEIPQRVKILPEIACTKTIKKLLSKDRAGIISLFIFLLLPIIGNILKIFDSSLNKTIRSLKRADIIVSCGGNQLHSNGGFTFLRHLYPIIYGKLIYKKPIMIFSQSIGPISGNLSQQLLKFLLERINCITLRERVSKRYLLDVLFVRNPNIFVTADALFMMDLNTQNLQSKKKSDPQKIGITIRQWFFRNKDYYNNYIRVIVSFINYLNEVHNIEVVLFSFSQLPGYGEDMTACQEVYDSVTNKNRLNLVQLGKLSVEEVSNELQKIDLLIGTRMHSVIFASLLNIPAISISYQHHKSEGISKMLGLLRPLNIETLTFNQLVDVYEELKHFSPLALQTRVQKLRTKSKVNLEIMKRLVEHNIPHVK